MIIFRKEISPEIMAQMPEKGELNPAFTGDTLGIVKRILREDFDSLASSLKRFLRVGASQDGWILPNE